MRKSLLSLGFTLLYICASSAVGPVGLAYDDVDELKCSGEIVSIGDQMAVVESICGPPSAIEQDGRLWIYNFGPTEFLYYLTFANDRLQRIQTGERGK